MVGQSETMWIVTLAVLTYVPTIAALVLIIGGAVARRRVVALDVLDLTMVLVFCWIGALVYFLILFLRRRGDTQTTVAPAHVIRESEATLARVDEAYARAWAESQTAADDVLIDVLHQTGLGPTWTEPGRPQADLLVAVWRSGATPRSSSKQLREAFRVRPVHAGELSRDDSVR